MAVRAPAVEIMNLSLGQLRRLADAAGLTVSMTAAKRELVQQLIQLDPGDLQRLAADYLYAGRTSVSWFRLGNQSVELETLKTALQSLMGRDAFASASMPSVVSAEPHLIEALEWRPGKIVLRFVARKREQLILRDMQLVPVVEDETFVVVFRPATAIVEARCSSDRARSMKTWFADLAQALGTPLVQIGFPSVSVDALRAQLDGKLALYTGKDLTGSIYDTRSMTKSDACEDLATEAQFAQDIVGLDPVNEEILYLSPHEGERVRILVGLRSNSLYFRTMSSEAVIDEVFAAIRQVNGF